jgi:hypothetical protein
VSWTPLDSTGSSFSCVLSTMSGIIGGKTRLWLDRVVKTEYPSHSETQFTTP